MKFRAPLYYKNFHCIADKCKDSCCSAGWEIDIDNQTEEFYRNAKGDFGDKLRANISETSPCHFILDKHNNCPFLNDKKLCDIYINLGEEHLCQICKDHPRYYEWFDDIGFKEAGIGLCCEEAARIILSDDNAFEIYEEDFAEENCNNFISRDSFCIEKDTAKAEDINSTYDASFDYNYKLYMYLFSARDNIFKYLENNDISLVSKLHNILWYANTLQQDIDSGLLDEENIFDVSGKKDTSIKLLIDYLSTLEPNDKKWPDYLKKCAKLESEFKRDLRLFEECNPEAQNYLKNVSAYFIWRYFLKAVFDEDVLSKVKLMYVSVLALRFLFFCEWYETGVLCLEDCIKIVKKFSEEVEYSEDNLFKFAEDSYDIDELETEYLLGL